MNKKLILGSLAVCAAGTAIYTAVVAKKGKAFESTLDKSPESMDESVLWGGKLKLFNGQVMEDLNVGAFFGGMELDFTGVITEKKVYHMDIQIMNGGINIIVPENFNIKLVDRCRFGGVANNTISNDPESEVTLFVFADIIFGGLNFENPKAAISELS